MQVFSRQSIPRDKVFGGFTFKGGSVDAGTPPVSRYTSTLLFPADRNFRIGAFSASEGHVLPPSLLARGAGQLPLWKGRSHLEQTELAERAVISEQAIYGGWLFDHFGHFLLETLSRLWVLERSDIGRTLYFHARAGDDVEDKPWRRDLLKAAGPAMDIQIVKQPTFCKELLVPWPMMSIRYYLTAEYLAFCRRIGNRLVTSGPNTPEKIYLSRERMKGDRRAIVNEVEIIAHFADRGFTPVHLENMPAEEQIRYFRNAQEVAGTTGSAFHWLLFCDAPKRTTYLTAQPNINANFLLIDRARGDESTFVFLSAQKCEGGLAVYPEEVHRLAALDETCAAQRIDGVQGLT